MLQFKTKNATFGSIINGRMEQHLIPVSKQSILKVVFGAISSYGYFKDLNVSSKLFKQMTTALAYMKLQKIFYRAVRDKM